MIFEEILDMARAQNATDIHFSSDQQIYFRVDGVLTPISLQCHIQDMIEQLLTARQKEKLQMLEDVDFIYQDRFQRRYRINVFQEKRSLTMAVRLIYDNMMMLDQHYPDVFKKLTQLKNGLVIITGPTGSGKSTTLAALLHYMNTHQRLHIVTIEDPIEYLHHSKMSIVQQREIGIDVKNYDIALKSVLREDPDVVVVGEMRDWKTMQTVITLAETGHLVFSTMHTLGAVKSIDRIIDSFPEGYHDQIRTQLSTVLKAVISQQLIPLSHGGREAVYEIMMVNQAISHLMREKKTQMIYSHIQLGSQFGMQTMENHIRQLRDNQKISDTTAKEYLALLDIIDVQK